MITLRLTIPHRYSFGPFVDVGERGLTTSAAWDSLRSAEAASAFGFGENKQAWETRALSSDELNTRARSIAALLRTWHARTVLSVGVGTGMIEFLIKRLEPKIALRCGDFAPRTVALLAERFPECDSIEVMDLATPDWLRGPHEVLLLHRVDMELDDRAWRRVFTELHSRQCERIVFVPCGLITPVALMREARTVVDAVIHRHPLLPAGLLRTDARMRELFSGLYSLQVVPVDNGLPIWTLNRKA